ncbi:Metaxin-1 like [Pseudolycoriella hygida]|uniref:Metaxin-1 like n=1 Tax=Pseudolycoriella hygida TaxID=35572 RepID=A0A9Q0NBH2_9DIPT|nr:Metaxin-1 like [Pseudolycoriella hygida]
MEIFVYKGLYNLPSIDFECLRAISFIRLINAPVTIKIDGNPFKSPNGCLPYLKHNGTKIAGFTKIAAFLQDQGFDTTSQNRLSIAYTSYLYDNLYPYMQYFLWGDETNSENTRMLYAKRMIFPLSFCYPQRYAKRVDDLMMSIEQFSLNDKYEDHNVDGIIIRAKKCLNTLNEKIGNKPYFFQMSTELDATIYAYLSILYHIPMTKNPVKSHIQECPNLLKFLDKFGKRFFSTELKSYENERPNLSTNDLSNSETKNLSKHGPKILSALFAITVMSVYAIRNGIFSISGRDPMDVTNFDDGDEHEVFDES